MKGDEKRRFCDRCQLHVHNLSALPLGEQRALLANRTERICVIYAVRLDSVPVRAGIWLFVQRLLIPWRAIAAVAALILSLSSADASTRHTAKAPASESEHGSLSDGKTTGGSISTIFEEPLWRRILFFWRR